MSAIGFFFFFTVTEYIIIKIVKNNSPVTMIIKNKEIIISSKFVNFDKAFMKKIK